MLSIKNEPETMNSCNTICVKSFTLAFIRKNLTFSKNVGVISKCKFKVRSQLPVKFLLLYFACINMIFRSLDERFCSV